MFRLPTPSNSCCVTGVLPTRYSSFSQTPHRCLLMEERELSAPHPGPGDFYPVHCSRGSLLLDWFQPFFGAALEDQLMVKLEPMRAQNVRSRLIPAVGRVPTSNFVSPSHPSTRIHTELYNSRHHKVHQIIFVTRALVKFVEGASSGDNRKGQAMGSRNRSCDNGGL